MIVQE